MKGTLNLNKEHEVEVKVYTSLFPIIPPAEARQLAQRSVEPIACVRESSVFSPSFRPTITPMLSPVAPSSPPPTPIIPTISLKDIPVPTVMSPATLAPSATPMGSFRNTPIPEGMSK